jgi:tetrapyrrole (corrin/porphyrin) methylase-like protein
MTADDSASAGSTTDAIMEVPWNLVVPEVDIHLVGYGNRLPNDITLELLAVLKRCKRIFAVPPIHAPQFGIPPMESLLHLYSPDKHRKNTYAEWVELVLDAAAAEPPVAFATYGSAMVGAWSMHRILELAPQRGLTVHVTNATSSFDGIWADFNIDPCLGFEVWEANAFVRLDIRPNTSAHLLLPQAPFLDVSGGIDPETLRLQLSSNVTTLRDHLLRFYPPDHEVHFDTTGSGAGPHLTGPDIQTLALCDLDHPGRQQASTLLVPRAQLAAIDFERPAHPTVVSE